MATYAAESVSYMAKNGLEVVEEQAPKIKEFLR
jgi:hypothetical protein